ncbi:mannose-6-phosphate isomerase, class I [bacterium]|nr:mannose-6-phosphate isomerase, class I [bacterium]MBU1065928.1 mannose-6-phosphate isomerase, class I [bacterium]MBU1633128.1 mannose-6-phosphate isomerase, class I [bacterium]MBU1874447.1 mannose-6-phosphate isomerase, class I [bacterium]
MHDILKKPFRLYNTIQHYKWGSTLPDAFIPQLLGIDGEKNTNYAELWIGSHPNAPSKIKIEDDLVSLNDLIHRFPDLILGKYVADRFNNKLPFLFKVLSAAEALSIQAHPSKGQAELLHKTDPQHYPDTNHKPEIAIALDSLTALAGFATYYQCHKTVLRYPEITGFLGRDALSDLFPLRKLSRKQQSEKLRQMYQTFIHLTQTKPGLYQRSVNALAKRLRSQQIRRSSRENLFLDTLKKYGSSDVGLFSLFLLRMIRLKAGEAIAITPGIPHAYVQGNIIECMANSDNVVRAGLTKKFQDTRTLMTILDYTPNPVQIIKPIQSENEYNYPVFTSEFKISRLELASGSQILNTTNQLEIFLIINGFGILSWDYNENKEKISKGQSYIVPGILDNYTITSRSPMTIFRVQIP